MRSKQLKPSSSEVAATAPAPCAALVLAAGRGRRFGSDKRVAPMADGQTLLAATLARVPAQFDQVWVVIAGHDDAQALGVPPAVKVVRAQQAESGMGASLAAGIAALADSPCEVAAVLLGDMPWLAEGTLARLREAATAQHIVVPECQGRRGHPVLFGQAFWPELAQLQGDQGGRVVLLAHPRALRVIEVEDSGVWRDVDTPADLLGR